MPEASVESIVEGNGSFVYNIWWILLYVKVNMVTLAIIDVIGLTYDGNTLSKRGLGGSESAVILMSKELAALGFDVTVFNNCIDREATPGVYDGVTYRDLSSLREFNDYTFDVVISSRTVFPFLKENDYGQFMGRFDVSLFANIKKNAGYKAVWLHDTFCQGDHLLEQMMVDGDIDDLYTLSDFHTSYVTTCNHGNKRMLEVMKRKVFMTRNGAVQYPGEVDVYAKDRNLFVYNASVTKGMLPLVMNVWPIVKQIIPTAKLKIIGGYYRFRENAEPDEQEKTWRAMVADPKYAAMDIEFTGIIKQSEIAEILKQAAFMIYPPEFPETFGISSLESLLYNTPLITSRFGALEETAVEQACYFMDYPIVPNSLYPNIDPQSQALKFAQLAIDAWNNTYLWQQKAQYCNIVKGIHGWDSVALQWKQHIYSRLKLYMPVWEYRKVCEINARVRKVFGRRFSNLEEVYLPRRQEAPILVVTPTYNAANWIAKCIESVGTQDYDNWRMIVIDDCSTDDTCEVAKAASARFGRARTIVLKNDVNRGAVCNHIQTIRMYAEPGEIVMLIDGDDALVADNQIFQMYNNLYDGTTEFTYGSCWSMVDNIPLIAQPYPEAVKEARAYRSHKFAWNMPYTHLRTFDAKLLLQDEDDSPFKDDDGNWFKAGGDGATFYTLIERANPDYVKVVTDVVYLYNDTSPINDYKVNGDEQTRTANKILSRGNKVAPKPKLKSPVVSVTEKNEHYVPPMKTILIAIPTNKYIEPETMKSIYDLEVPEGYKTTFQYFFGYQVDQIRNLIAHWASNYDYLFAVDSDMSFAPDTLKKLLAHDKDVVSGLYIQRKPGQHILEIYRNGTNVPYNDIRGLGLIEVDGCGFGCVLVKSDVIRSIGYPQFVYKSALDHAYTVSEDTYFCLKAKEKGFRIWADTSILCGHHGASTFIVDANPPVPGPRGEVERLRDLGRQMLLPKAHVDHLFYMKQCGHNPKVVYDLGACVMHWTTVAQKVWPDAEYFLCEAMPEVAPIYDENGVKNYHLGVLSDVDGRELTFYQNTNHPGGNSYYKENAEVNPVADEYFNEAHARTVYARSLDSIIEEYDWPLPDLIKMDVQGAELDVLKGATKALAHCKNLILELQKVEYNKGAPLKNDVIEYLNSIGFVMCGDKPFCDNGPDGDYQFTKLGT